MVKIALQLKAVLENCSELKPEDEDFRWYLKHKCGNCGDTPGICSYLFQFRIQIKAYNILEHWQYVTLSESHPLKGGRGEAR